MNNGSSMHVLERFGELIDNESNVDVLEYALGDDVVEIRLHELEEQVYVLIIISADGVKELDDVGMVELLEDLDFSIGALRISGMLKCIEYLLKRENALGGLLFHLPHVAVCPRAYLLQDVEATQDVALDEGSVVLRHIKLNYRDEM